MIPEDAPEVFGIDWGLEGAPKSLGIAYKSK
jgi:hypothetical protein